MLSASRSDASDSDDEAAPTLIFLNERPNTEENEELPPCPVTILSGFLGSGKTTLIKYILNSPDHGKRIAVIENEFGEGLAIESMIARDGVNNSLTDLIELPNGCICCTVKDTLVSTLENLLSKRKDLDYILIECSGMANPGPIASLFWLDNALESRLRLDGIITLADAANIEHQLETTEEAPLQIAYAERILLNKVDLVGKEHLSRVEDKIRQLHPTAPIRRTTYSTVPDLDWILDANCFDAERAKDVELELEQLEQHNHSHDHEGPGAICTSHKHTKAITTISLKQAGSIDLTKVNKWLASILWPNQDERDKVLRAMVEGEESFAAKKENVQNGQQIYRIKGILSVQHHSGDSPDYEEEYLDTMGNDCRRFIIQAVHDLWEIYPASSSLKWQENDIRLCQLIMIGRYLDKESLESNFRDCFV